MKSPTPGMWRRVLHRVLLGFAIVSGSAMGQSADEITVPEGYVLQVLGATDGRIAMPKAWFYSNSGTPSGWVWRFSPQDPHLGEFETGLTIQLFVRVEEKTKQSPEAFARSFIAEKHVKSRQVLRDCPVANFDSFKRQCIEVIEDLKEPSGLKRFHILYSAMWLKEMDMVAISTFGAPEEKWESVRETADVMSMFVLIGKSPGNTN